MPIISPSIISLLRTWLVVKEDRLFRVVKENRVLQAVPENRTHAVTDIQ